MGQDLVEPVQVQAAVDASWKGGSICTALAGTPDQMADLKVEPKAIRIVREQPFFGD